MMRNMAMRPTASRRPIRIARRCALTQCLRDLHQELELQLRVPLDQGNKLDEWKPMQRDRRDSLEGIEIAAAFGQPEDVVAKEKCAQSRIFRSEASGSS